jgi:DNA-binding response OmpR family regulator
MPRPCVLVVDDEPDVATLLRFVCEMAGCEAVIANTLGEARARLAEQPPPSVVLLDLGLDDGDSYAFCREVRAGHPGVHLLIVSARVYSDSEARARAAGADGFVAKPFDPDTLAAVVRELLPLPGR